TGLLSMSTAAFTGAALDPDTTMKQAFDSVTKNIATELAYYGVTYAGGSMGIDPQVSYLAGIGIRSSLQMGFSAGGGDPGAWIDGAILGATQGITQIGLNYLLDELELPPIVQQMGSQLLNSLAPGIASVFSNMYRSFADNALTTGGKPCKSDPKYWSINTLTGASEFKLDDYASDMANWSWQEQGYQSMAEDFTNQIQDQGFEQAMNNYGVSLFDYESLNAIDTFGLSAGEYFQDRLNNSTFEMATLIDGVNVAKVGIEDNLGNNYGYAYFREDSTGGYSDLYGYSYGNYEAFGNLFADSYGDLKFMNGQIAETIGDYVVNQMISNGMQEYVQFRDLYGEVVFGISPAAEGGGIYVGENGQLYGGKIIGDGYICSIGDDFLSYKNTDSGLKWTVDLEGNLGLDLNGNLNLTTEEINLFSTLSDEQKKQALTAIMFFGNGFGNDSLEGHSPTIMNLFMQDLIADEIISPNNAFGITTYEHSNSLFGLLSNSYLWSMDAVSSTYNPVTNEITSELYGFLSQLSPEQLSAEIVYFSHSGQFRPLVETLNNNPGMPINTIFNFEGPYVGEQIINNDNINRVINVYGTQPAFGIDDIFQTLQLGPAGAFLSLINRDDEPVPFLGPVNFTGLDADGNEFDIENYNFEIIGARHSDFSYNPNNANLTPEQRGINIATNFFMRQLSEAVVDNDPLRMTDFAMKNGISYDNERGVFVVDPTEFERENR
ncbi:MAG: hypothetical protein ABIA77_01405, partial [Candidatus Omnitrophota bacterium]